MNKIIKNLELFKRVLSRESYPNRAVHFIQSFHYNLTSQRGDYWLHRYYRLYEIDVNVNLTFYKEEMSEEDWEYLESLLPRTTPSDPFLLDQQNKEFT